jgi:hypothetical protein
VASADAEVVQAAAVAQGELAELVDDVVVVQDPADRRGRGHCQPVLG